MSILFQPFKAKNIALENRLIRSATSESLSDPDGRVTEEQIRLYERLARGGVGLIETCFASVHRTGRNLPCGMGIDDDSLIPDLSKLTDVVHRNGSKIIVQLAHGGAQTNPKTINARPMAPSRVFQTAFWTFARRMTEDDIWMIVDAFGKAAERAKRAGFDGVQIHAAHGYLVHQFLARRTNYRRDEWGKGREGRFRFLEEVYRAIRKAVGDDYPIFMKMNVKDYLPGGVDLPYARFVAEAASGMGVDAIEISGGVYETILFMTRGGIPVDSILRRAPSRFRHMLHGGVNRLRVPFRFEPAYFRKYAAGVKEVVRCPLILVGGLRDVAMMEDIVEKKEADLLALSRPLIRNPNLPALMKRGVKAESDCLNCNRCLAAVSLDKPLRCYAKATP